MTRCWTYRVLLAAAAVLAKTPTPVEAQDSLAVYLPVLERVRDTYPERPVYLYSLRLRMECVRGGCEVPRTAPLPPAWLSSVRGEGIVTESCGFDRGSCLRANGEPILDPEGAYAMLGTWRACGDDCVETLAEVTAREEVGMIRRTTSYRLVRTDGEWRVDSTTPLGWSILD